MKTLWNLVSVIAVVNLLAVAGLVLWLVGSGRVDRDRFVAVKELLAAPRAEPLVKTVATKPADESRDITPTEARISAQDRAERQLALNLRRLHDEREQLAKSLSDGEKDLASRVKSFETERKTWEDATSQMRKDATGEQFRKAVKMLESVTAKQAKDWLLDLCSAGATDQAVAYLDAMSPYKAANVMKTFKTDTENKLATDLLERLRQRTPDARLKNAATAAPSNADASDASSDSPANKPSGPVANAGAEVGGPRDGAKR
ncbi:MAG: hypothetical protein U0572_12110 [Phycisphaerales bacterium]